MWWRALIGMGLASVVWLAGLLASGSGFLDGPCSANEFRLSVREGSSGTSEWSWLPPREICVEERLDGSRREVAYPGPVTFATAGFALLLPLIPRRPRRRRPPGRGATAR